MACKAALTLSKLVSCRAKVVVTSLPNSVFVLPRVSIVGTCSDTTDKSEFRRGEGVEEDKEIMRAIEFKI